MTSQDVFVIGVDYGTDSVRSIIVNAINGKKLPLLFFIIHDGKMNCIAMPAANQFRQHPLDYIEGLEDTIKRCLYKPVQMLRLM